MGAGWWAAVSCLRARPGVGAGLAGLLALIFSIYAVLWFGFQGQEFVGRPWAVLLSMMSGLSLIAGVRLLVVAQGFLQWRTLKASRSDAPFLSDGYLSPHQTRLAGVACLVVGSICLGGVWFVWGPDVSWRVFVASGVWLCAPAWVMHLAMGRPEPRR